MDVSSQIEETEGRDEIEFDEEKLSGVGLKFHEFMQQTTMAGIIEMAEAGMGLLELKNCEGGSTTGLQKYKGIQER